MNKKKCFQVIIGTALFSAILAASGASTYAEIENSESADSVRNILLIGSDHRDDSWNGNSDVMMVASINDERKEIVLTSFMRDLYADIPGQGVHKLNYAYAVGGAETLKNTLESNYGIQIDHHAVVDFESMADIVDIVGGVDLTVSDAEAEMINGYLYSMDATEYNLPGGGSFTLNGWQAVAHMRDRFVGNNDYERTQRQRDVLTGLFEKARSMDIGQMAKISAELMTDVEHDFNAVEMLALASELPDLVQYTMIENRIPYDDLYYSQNEMLVPDFEQTRERLHEIIGE